MSINLAPDLERAVTDEARRLGTTPEGFVEQTLRQRIAETRQPKATAVEDREERLQRLLSIVRTYGISHTNESLSSEGLYD